MLTDIIDKVPQIRVDYANHVIYGALLGYVAQFAVSLPVAALIVLGVAGAKKTFDYFEEHETLEVCISKTIVTAAVPIILSFTF